MIRKSVYLFAFNLLLCASSMAQRSHVSFDSGWKFFLGDDSLAISPTYNDSKWRSLNLPHDWSIEGAFSDKNTSTPNEAGLPTGIGWYRKTFTLDRSDSGQRFVLQFDGIFRAGTALIFGFFSITVLLGRERRRRK